MNEDNAKSLHKIGIIVAIVIAICSLVFSLGVTYQQISQVKIDILELRSTIKSINNIETSLARIQILMEQRDKRLDSIEKNIDKLEQKITNNSRNSGK